MRTTRVLPQSFRFPFGSGMIREEVSVKCPHWEPVIQLLQFEDGSKALRFCVYHGSRFARISLVISQKYLKRLGRQVRRYRNISKLLKLLTA